MAKKAAKKVAARAAPSGTALDSAFVADMAEPVRDHLAGSTDLPDFLRTAGTLSLDERKLLVEQAIVLLEQNYVHLPLKVAMHAVNPVQRLRVIHAQLERSDPGIVGPEWRFHAALSAVFHSVRDLHTNYLLPAPFNTKIAYLPFQVEEYADNGEPHHLISRLVQGYPAPAGFAPGAEVTHWSGIPIAQAIAINAARFAGSNEAARHSRGLESLTLRALRSHLPPDEEWVTVSYVGTDGQPAELREKWLVADNLPSMTGDLDSVSEAAGAMGLDLDADEANRARKLLFAPHVVALEQHGAALGSLGKETAEGEDLPSEMPGVFRARRVATPSGEFGHIRIFTFGVNDPGPFVAEFVRLIELLPQNGLIVDVRGNGGGHIFASEFTLQTLTPRPIVPEPVQFVATPLNARICKQHKDNPTGQFDLGPWHRSLQQATETGAAFSAAFPLTPVDGANAIGQRYCGPVVLITDARCYSATDIFAAGFQDHAIGPVLGVDANTGAGGANVWTHGLLMDILSIPEPDPESPYRSLPKGANMRVAIRRTLRVGSASGTPLEDLGVEPDHRHPLTRDDVLNGNVDLLARAGEILAGLPAHGLTVKATAAAGGEVTVEVEGTNVDRADVYVDGRPRDSVDVAGVPVSVTVPGKKGAIVRVEGFASGKLVASRTAAVAARRGAARKR